jgi:hypothetical protein
VAWLAVAMPANVLFSVKDKHFREENYEGRVN